MSDLLALIYEWFYEWFIMPFYDFIINFISPDFIETPIVITMPGSNTPLISAPFEEFVVFACGIFVFICSIICFIGVLKFFYKMGRRLFGGRR